MPTDKPSKSLSHKLLGLGRLSSKGSGGGAKSPEPADKDKEQDDHRFQIVHTPDRHTPTRPTPTEEECREEIRRWHALADRERYSYLVGGGEDVLDHQRRSPENENPGNGEEMKKGKYDFEDSPVEDERGIQSGGDVEMEETGAEEPRASRQRRYAFAVSAQAAAAAVERTREEKVPREMGGFADPPVFRPARPWNGIELGGGGGGNKRGGEEEGRRSSTTLPAGDGSGSGSVRIPIPAAGSLARERSESRSPRSCSVGFDLDGLSLSEEGGGRSLGSSSSRGGSAERGGGGDGWWAVCPACGSVLSRIERVRCGRCRFDLVGGRGRTTGVVGGQQQVQERVSSQESEGEQRIRGVRHGGTEETWRSTGAADEKSYGSLKPSPGRYLPSTPPKSPPPLRERSFLPTGYAARSCSPRIHNTGDVLHPSQPDTRHAQQQQYQDRRQDRQHRTNPRFVQFPTTPLRGLQRSQTTDGRVPDHTHAAQTAEQAQPVPLARRVSAGGQGRDNSAACVRMARRDAVRRGRGRAGERDDGEVYMDIYGEYED
ncbi:hypothetical protein QBC47DRAFT_428247 [Echria macrotheca]|uniref:Uncharacterized protein n=1 Tax=Echria macrotheca TaxID=438768 RepID=A0AAJ0FGD3_9PEZI|nr:hypothetical protein QBC47DRAFT_428247 [Echria macrotheca]